MAFNLATFLVVPLLVSRNIPGRCRQGKPAMLKKTWGENIIGNSGMGLVFGLGYVALALLGTATVVGLANMQGLLLAVTAAALFVIAFILLALIQADFKVCIPPRRSNSPPPATERRGF